MQLSLIIPIYNTEAYIAECLDSILRQNVSKENYEIVCVNDGSSDGSLGILRKYEQIFTNIKVIDQRNGGVCKARNVGLFHALGEYVWYVDADDFLSKNALEKVLDKLASTKCDRLIIDNYLYFDDEKSEEEMPRNSSWENSVVWRNLFRRDFLISQDLVFRYEELSFGEDALYMYEVRRALPKTDVLAEPLYIHRERPGSLSTEMSEKTEIKRLMCNIREAEILKYYHELGGVLEQETADRFMSFLWGALFRIAQMPNKQARNYLLQMKQKGLFPYRRPIKCSIKKCPGNNRSDLIGRITDCLYTNLGSIWGYYGIRLMTFLYCIKQKIGQSKMGKK